MSFLRLPASSLVLGLVKETQTRHRWHLALMAGAAVAHNFGLASSEKARLQNGKDRCCDRFCGSDRDCDSKFHARTAKLIMTLIL